MSKIYESLAPMSTIGMPDGLAAQYVAKFRARIDASRWEREFVLRQAALRLRPGASGVLGVWRFVVDAQIVHGGLCCLGYATGSVGVASATWLFGGWSFVDSFVDLERRVRFENPFVVDTDYEGLFLPPGGES